MESAPFRDRKAQHFAHKPFGQAPWLTDGDLTIFESGAILLHLGELSPAMLPPDRRGRAEAIQWLFAALNSVEMASLPWSIFHFTGQTGEASGFKFFDDFLKARLAHMEPVLAGREWLAGSFSVADILMADVLLLVDRFEGLAAYPACRAYVARATARPAFVKAHADQLAHCRPGSGRALPSRCGGGERGDRGSGQQEADEAADAASGLGRVAQEDFRLRRVRLRRVWRQAAGLGVREGSTRGAGDSGAPGLVHNRCEPSPGARATPGRVVLRLKTAKRPKPLPCT